MRRSASEGRECWPAFGRSPASRCETSGVGREGELPGVEEVFGIGEGDELRWDGEDTTSEREWLASGREKATIGRVFGGEGSGPHRGEGGLRVRGE